MVCILYCHVGLSLKLLTDNQDPVVIFSREPIETGFRNFFSVISPKNPALARVRAVVTFVGPDSGDGIWECSKDGQNSQGCHHIKQAQQYLCTFGTEDITTDQPLILGMTHFYYKVIF